MHYVHNDICGTLQDTLCVSASMACMACIHYWYITTYCIAGNIGGELSLADWRFGKETVILKSTNNVLTIVTGNHE